jgi:hypothetical protein
MRAAPLSVMLRVLGWAAIPCWPLGAAAAVLWSGRLELLLLAVAGTSSAVTLRVLRWADARLARRAAEWERREAQHERLEGKLCDSLVANLPVPGRAAAKTLPDLRIAR